MIKLGSSFYDSREGRLITVDAVGCNPKYYWCVVEEYDPVLDDVTITSTQYFTEYELNKFEKRITF